MPPQLSSIYIMCSYLFDHKSHIPLYEFFSNFFGTWCDSVMFWLEVITVHAWHCAPHHWCMQTLALKDSTSTRCFKISKFKYVTHMNNWYLCSTWNYINCFSFYLCSSVHSLSLFIPWLTWSAALTWGCSCARCTPPCVWCTVRCPCHVAPSANGPRMSVTNSWRYLE